MLPIKMLVKTLNITLATLLVASPAFAKTLMTKGKGAAAPAPVSAPVAAKSASRAPASIDPNRAVEIRGQSRTLSMMLVLKKGKENINFIKVRKDYNAEIKATEF